MSSSAAVFNEGSANIDFRVESNASTHALFVDAGSEAVGVFTSSPNAPLHVQTSHTSSDVTAANNNATLNIGNSGTGNGVYNAIKFSGNQQDMYMMSFNNSAQGSRRLGFFVGSVAGDATTDERLSINGNGSVGIGTLDGDVTGDGTSARTYVGIIGTANRGRLNLGSTASNGADSGVISFVNGANELGNINMETNSGSQTVGKMYISSTDIVDVRAAGGVIFNEGGVDADFRIESDDNANMFFIDGNENRIGIGTNSNVSEARLQVDVATTSPNAGSRTANSALMVSGGTTTVGEGPVIALRNISGSKESITMLCTETVSGNNGDFTISIYDGGATIPEVARLTSSGSMGLGTSAPIALDGNAEPGLTIASNGPFICLQDANNADKVNYIANNTGVLQFGHVGDNGASGKTENLSLSSSEAVFNESHNNIDFRVESDGNSTMLVVDAANNFVGVGTGTPQEILHAFHSSGTAAIRVSGEGNNNRKCQIEYNATDGPIIRAGSSGITSLKFAVDNSTLAGKFDTNADFYTNDGTVHSLSDIRVKTDVEDLADGLDIVKQLKPRTFRYTEDSEFYNEDTKDEIRYGFVANEVEAVAPQYTDTGKGNIGGEEVDDLKSLSTTKMIPMLVKAIQEQSAIIDDLRARVAELETN
jgi:hypothetical protein